MKAYRAACGWSFTAAKPIGWRPVPVVIDVVYRAFRGCGGYHPKDIQNAISAVKPMVDGLVDAGIAPSDASRWLQWGEFRLITTAAKAKKLGAGVTVTVRRA